MSSSELFLLERERWENEWPVKALSIVSIEVGKHSLTKRILRRLSSFSFKLPLLMLRNKSTEVCPSRSSLSSSLTHFASPLVKFYNRRVFLTFHFWVVQMGIASFLELCWQFSCRFSALKSGGLDFKDDQTHLLLCLMKYLRIMAFSNKIIYMKSTAASCIRQINLVWFEKVLFTYVSLKKFIKYSKFSRCLSM